VARAVNNYQTKRSSVSSIPGEGCFFFLSLYWLDNRQPKRYFAACSSQLGCQLFAVGGFGTNVGNPTVYPPGNPPTLLTVLSYKKFMHFALGRFVNLAQDDYDIMVSLPII
jgi:hypothetical protein